jgi:hypothetical protein
MKFDAAQKHLRTLGISLSYYSPDYRVNFLRGNLNSEQITDDLAEAIRLGEEMAAKGLPKTPFLTGPLPRGGGARAHNLKRLKQHWKTKGERDG